MDGLIGGANLGGNHLRLGSLSTIIAKRGWLICTIPNGGWEWDFWLPSTVGGVQISMGYSGSCKGW